MSASPTVLLVDGHSLAYRAYYAFAKSREGGLRTSGGIPTSVCFGFVRSLLDTIASHHPDYVAIAFDTREATFRHEADANYKANRAETPEDFIPDVENLKTLLDAFNFPILTAPGYEADDILGTLTRHASDRHFTVKILSGDRDLFQLVNDARHVSVLHLPGGYGKGRNAQPVEYHEAQVKDKLGVSPAEVVDFKALCGDSSDNLPGVKGIGEKTAVKLIDAYHSLDGIYNAIDEIRGAQKKRLEAGKEEAYHTQFMVRIECEVPLNIDWNAYQLQGFDTAEVRPILEKLELKSLLDNLHHLQTQLGGTQTAADAPAEAEDEDTWFFSPEDTANSQQPQNSDITPEIIDTEEKLQALIDRLQRHTHPETPVAWDTETSSTKPIDAELVGLGCCWGDAADAIAYIPVGHTHGTQLDKTTVLEALRPILKSDEYPKALQNAKYDRLVLRSQGIDLKGVVFDTMLASYVLDPETTHNLSDLGLRHLDITAQSYKELVPKGKTIGEIAIPLVTNYCGTDVHVTYRLVPLLRQQLAEVPKLQKLYNDVELPLEPVLAEMEYSGICIDVEYLKDLSKKLESQLDSIEREAYKVAGEEFNLKSPKQLSTLLFETLELDKRKTSKTKTGYSTNAAVLEKLQGDHPVVDCILEHRTLSKLKSTYVDALPELVHPDSCRIHTDFNQAITATGRLSSSNPNLQNIPIRTEFSRQIRKAFVPRDGWILAAADYSQIELRILAHLSQEPVLIEAYQNNRDVHRLTAQLLFEKDEVTSDERRLGKTINFGVIYGMGAQRFAREAGVSTAQGRDFIDRYNDRYAKVFEYLQQMKREAIAHGYVETLLGRRRYFNFESGSLRKLQGSNPDDIQLDKFKRLGLADSQALRAAANAPIQGSSADIIKIAMVKLFDLLRDYDAQLLLQVHDELVFELPESEWETLQPQIKEAMESAVNLSVPLVVDIHAGDNWMETK
ncbi:DNA polymerase I [Leptolyngbya valderiana BDU 20041]|nr:DNA polymerase I [Leptolyngbya valderiana BDU 20041]